MQGSGQARGGSDKRLFHLGMSFPGWAQSWPNPGPILAQSWRSPGPTRRALAQPNAGMRA